MTGIDLVFLLFSFLSFASSNLSYDVFTPIDAEREAVLRGERRSNCTTGGGGCEDEGE